MKERLTTTGYTTDYIEIMLEVIEEQGISNTYQGKKELLSTIILQKMIARGLPKSNHLANSLATAIRLPESQKGGLGRPK